MKKKCIGLFFCALLLTMTACKNAKEEPETEVELASEVETTIETEISSEIEVLSETEVPSETEILVETEISTETEEAYETEVSSEVEASSEGADTLVEDVPLKEGITIKETCTHVTNKIANEAFAEIQELECLTQKDVYKIENYTMEFFAEKEKKDGRIWVHVMVVSDWTLIRHPKESPFILGMMEIRDELKDEAAIAYADKEIEGWLVEMEPSYLVTKKHPQEYLLAFEPGKEDYDIYYDDNDEMMPLEDYIKEYCTEDADARKEQGRQQMLLYLKSWASDQQE